MGAFCCRNKYDNNGEYFGDKRGKGVKGNKVDGNNFKDIVDESTVCDNISDIMRMIFPCKIRSNNSDCNCNVELIIFKNSKGSLGRFDDFRTDISSNIIEHNMLPCSDLTSSMIMKTKPSQIRPSSLSNNKNIAIS